MHDIDIRPARIDDLDSVAALEGVVFPSPWRREFFEGELRAPGRFCLVATSRERDVVGYLFSMQIFDEMHINKIAVAPEMQRSGVATALMDECLRFARNRQVTLLTLEVRKSNLPAQEFYENLEFEPSYTRPNYYPDGETAIVMSLQL